MSVVIRLARGGRKKLPYYRLVVADKECARDGRYIEQLGTVDPLANPSTVTLDEERVKYWVGVGAQPSQTAYTAISSKLPGYLDGIYAGRLAKLQAARKKRKAAAGTKKAPAAKKTASKKATKH